MRKLSLPRSVVKKIMGAVDSLYDRAIAKILGRPPVDKRIYISSKPRVTLSSLFEDASAEERTKPDTTTLATLLDIAEGFINAQRHATKAHVVKSVENWLNTAQEKDVDTDVETVLGGELAEVWRKAHDGMAKIVAAESNVVKNTGGLNGIIRVNAAAGVEDPVMYFVVVRDENLCLAVGERVPNNRGDLVCVEDLRVGDRLAHVSRPSQGGGLRVLRVNRKPSEVLDLKFDNGRSLRCSPDHPILVRAGHTFCFVEARLLRDDHDVVFIEDLNTKGERQRLSHSTRPRPFMQGHIDQWSFWRENVHIIAKLCEKTRSRQQAMKEYGISTTEWDKWVHPVLKVYFPNLRCVGRSPHNTFSADFIRNRDQQYSERYITGGGDEHLVRMILAGETIRSVAAALRIPFRVLRPHARRLGLISTIRARGGAANWRKNRTTLIAKAITRGAPHLRGVTSQPELKLVNMIQDTGLTVLHSYVIGNMKVDAYLPEFRVVIEYDGSGHTMRDRLVKKLGVGRTTAQRDFARDRFLRSQGYRVLRIKDPKDKVPPGVIDEIKRFVTSDQEFFLWHA